VIRSKVGSCAPAGYRFPREVIAVAVRWYLRYGLSGTVALVGRQQQRHGPDDRHAAGFILGTGWLPVSA
jgi:hypothetical protein